MHSTWVSIRETISESKFTARPRLGHGKSVARAGRSSPRRPRATRRSRSPTSARLNDDPLWATPSLRDLVGVVLTVEVLQQCVHSGTASGLVPSSFRIARKPLNRLDDVDTGHLLPAGLHALIPDERLEQARAAGTILCAPVWKQFPWVGCNHGPDAPTDAMPTTTDSTEAILSRTSRPAVAGVVAAVR